MPKEKKIEHKDGENKERKRRNESQMEWWQLQIRMPIKMLFSTYAVLKRGRGNEQKLPEPKNSMTQTLNS